MNDALMNRPMRQLEPNSHPPSGPLWCGAAVIERPKGHVVAFGPAFVTAPDEGAALAEVETILERAFPAADGYRRSFDVAQIPPGVLRLGEGA